MSRHLDPRQEFGDRIMAAIAGESAPTPARAFLSALRARSADDAASALWVAWHLATVRRWRIAHGVRARSIALVLAVACALGTGSLTAAAALSVAAEPVVQLLQSGVDERGQVENDPSVVDQHRDVQPNQPGSEEQAGGETVDNEQSGTEEPSGQPADDERPISVEPATGGADNDEGDEPADQDDEDGEAASDEPADQADEDADDGNPGSEPADQDDEDDEAEPSGSDEPAESDPVEGDPSGVEPPDDDGAAIDDAGSDFGTRP